MKAAAVQLNSGAEVEANIAAADELVRAAAADGATLVVLPEKWTVIGSPDDLRAGAQTLDGNAISWAREIARELKLDLVAGSISERVEGREKLGNASVHIGPDGEIEAVYRKMHMFDVVIEGKRYCESDTDEAGEEVVSSVLEDGSKLGMAICYDLRFPELYRGYRDITLIVVPSAFTAVTGAAHWHVLLKARAIENQCYVLAAAQGGTHANGRRTYGHSVLIDPWGTVVAELADGEGVIVGEIDAARIAQVRRDLPAVSHRRLA